METITYSYLESISHGELISLLKRFAKLEKAADSAGRPLAWHQDCVSHLLGFNNWSLLHKHVDGLVGSPFDLVVRKVLDQEELGDFVSESAVRNVAVDDAVEEMKAWARKKYTPLIEFAYYDNESPTGYSWPEVDMAEELAGEFEGKFPLDLIVKVGNALDVDEGLWGLEDYGD